MNILVWLGNKKMHPAIYPNMQSIAQALAELGHDVVTCNTANEEEIMAALSLLREEKIIDLSIGSNAMVMQMNFADNQMLDVYADLDVTHISILLDEPFNSYCNGYDKPAKNHIITYLDGTDREYFFKMNLASDKYKLFMPLGGTESKLSIEELLEKKRKSSYEVVFSAGSFGDCSRGPLWEKFGPLPGKYMLNILMDMLSLLRSKPVSVVTAAKAVLKSKGMEEIYYFQALAMFFPAILDYIKAWRRKKLVVELLNAGIALDVFGAGWDKMDLPQGAKLHGAIAYEDMLKVMSKAKIVVNDEACFNEGAHDRVFTAMLNGAVVVSEYSSYLAEEFVADQDLVMFDWQNIGEQLLIIPKLLSDDDYRERIARNAYNKVINRHTWRNRAERLLEAAEIMKFNHTLRAGKI